MINIGSILKYALPIVAGVLPTLLQPSETTTFNPTNRVPEPVCVSKQLSSNDIVDQSTREMISPFTIYKLPDNSTINFNINLYCDPSSSR